MKKNFDYKFFGVGEVYVIEAEGRWLLLSKWVGYYHRPKGRFYNDKGVEVVLDLLDLWEKGVRKE